MSLPAGSRGDVRLAAYAAARILDAVISRLECSVSALKAGVVSNECLPSVTEALCSLAAAVPTPQGGNASTRQTTETRYFLDLVCISAGKSLA